MASQCAEPFAWSPLSEPRFWMDWGSSHYEWTSSKHPHCKYTTTSNTTVLNIKQRISGCRISVPGSLSGFRGRQGIFTRIIIKWKWKNNEFISFFIISQATAWELSLKILDQTKFNKTADVHFRMAVLTYGHYQWRSEGPAGSATAGGPQGWRGPPGRSSRRKPLARGPNKLFAGARKSLLRHWSLPVHPNYIITVLY